MLTDLTPSQQINFQGHLVLTTTKNVEELQLDDIPFISCELSEYPDGDIDAGTIINSVLNNQALAIVLYSIYAATCLFHPSNDFQYSTIYSMQNAISSAGIVRGLQDNNPPNPLASISVDQSSSTGAAKVQSTSTSAAKVQNTSTGMTKMTKLIIEIVVGIVIPILLVITGLANFYIVRKRRRRRDEAGIAHQDTEGEGQDPQLHFQQKAELDDEQRRHEMEAVEMRFEMDGKDAIHEMPIEEREGHSGRQELRGEEHSKELENAL